jgi:malonate-semialdehyde dehydrogenase (acetylating)/methylmalonate-semialdehyde dehydrogenase
VVPNLIRGRWSRPETSTLPIYDPARGEVIDQVPLSGAAEVDRAVQAAADAFPEWSRTPVLDRTALMFRFKAKLEEHAEELAGIVTRHHGKTLDEARGEVRRGIEVVDFACGAPTLLQGRTLRNVAGGVDQDMYRFPVGVVVGIPPFNFPVMIPLWMVPLALVCGNTFVLKPSERTPLGAVRLGELLIEAGLPDGVFNLVNGAAEEVDALLRHPRVSAVSFVGSAPVAEHVYREAAATGKRVQALGGAKNHIVVLPDADLETAVPAICGSAFGNAGERCLAGSVVVAVGEAGNRLMDPLAARAQGMRVGPGTEAGVEVGPLIRREHRDRVAGFVDRGEQEGATILVDGRSEMGRDGFFLGPTLLDGVEEGTSAAVDEIFGPVLSVRRAATLGEAIESANRSSLGNMAVLFTSSGRAAREFRERVDAGMVGVNVPVAQPFAFYPFSGWKGSFFGDLHVHGTDGVDFYTRKKMFLSRW